jgi:hypothetical protein
LEKTERAIKNEQSRETFLDRGLLLTRKLLSQGFSLAKMKSSLRTFYGHYHDLITVTEYGFATRVTRSLVLCLCFVDRCFCFVPFSFDNCLVCPSLNYDFLITTFASSHSSINYVQMTKYGIGIIIWFNFDIVFTVMAYDERAYYLICKCWLRLSVGCA